MNCGARGHGWNPSSVPFSLYGLRWDSQSPSASIYGNVNSSYFMGCRFSELTYNMCLKECLEHHKYYLLFSLIIIAIFFSICILGLFWVMYECMCACFIRQESVTYYDGNHFEDGIKSGTRGMKPATVNSYSVAFLLQKELTRRQNSFISDF